MFKKDLFANLNQVVSVNAIAGLANACSAIWFARVLGPRVLGDYAIIVVALQVLTALMVPGFNQALIREPSRKDLVAAATLATAVQSLFVLILGGSAYGLSLWYRSAAVHALSLPCALLGASLILSFWANLLAAPLEAQMTYRIILRTKLIALIAGIAAGIAAAAQGLELYALVVRDVLTAVTTLALLRMASPLSLTWHRWRSGMKELLAYSRGLWGLNALEKLALRLDYAIVGLLFDKDVLGIYFAVRGLVEGGLGFIVSPIQTVMFSFYCRVRTHPAQLTMFLKKGAGLMSAASLSLGAAAFFAGPWVVEALLTGRYATGQTLLVGLVLYAGAIVWFENMKVLAMSRNVHGLLVVPRLAQLGVALTITFPLVRLAGLGGAGIAAGLSALSLALFATWLVTRQLAAPEHDLRSAALDRPAA